jgi:DNA polymerase-4
VFYTLQKKENKLKIHIDIDSFFVSAARIVDPSLKHKPVVIGGRSDTKIFSREAKNQTVNFQNSGSFVPTFYKAYEAKDDDIDAFMENGRLRGILTTASYEARAYGIKTAMSLREAKELCPELIIKAPNMSLYQELSHKLHDFLSRKIPLIEQASIDEFYGDVSGWVSDEEIPDFIDTLRYEIQKELQLPVSIGAASTRYIAKLATSYAKPFGCKTIYAKDFDNFINPIKVASFAGIGKSMLQKLTAAQINTLGELRKRKGTLYSWGPYAKELYNRVNGTSDAPIKTQHTRKSIGISRTFNPLFDREELKRRIYVLARHLSFAILKLGVTPTYFRLGIHYEMHTKSHTHTTKTEIFTEKKFTALCLHLFEQADKHKRLHIIRLSISCSHFAQEMKKTLSLLSFYEDMPAHLLTTSTQQLREKYGLDILKYAREL